MVRRYRTWNVLQVHTVHVMKHWSATKLSFATSNPILGTFQKSVWCNRSRAVFVRQENETDLSTWKKTDVDILYAYFSYLSWIDLHELSKSGSLDYVLRSQEALALLGAREMVHSELLCKEQTSNGHRLVLSCLKISNQEFLPFWNGNACRKLLCHLAQPFGPQKNW